MPREREPATPVGELAAAAPGGRRAARTGWREWLPYVALGFLVGRCTAPDAPPPPPDGVRAERRAERSGPSFVDADGLDGFLPLGADGTGSRRFVARVATPWRLGHGRVSFEFGVSESAGGDVLRVGLVERGSSSSLFGDAYVGPVRIEEHGTLVFLHAPFEVDNGGSRRSGSLTAEVRLDESRDELVVLVEGREVARLPRLRPERTAQPG